MLSVRRIFFPPPRDSSLMEVKGPPRHHDDAPRRPATRGRGLQGAAALAAGGHIISGPSSRANTDAGHFRRCLAGIRPTTGGGRGAGGAISSWVERGNAMGGGGGGEGGGGGVPPTFCLEKKRYLRNCWGNETL